MSGPRFSVVIPAYNEEKYLPRLLESIHTARRAYSRGADAVEVIVADNCSTDATADVAARHGAIVARVEKRVIAAARNGGAGVARGEFLGFVDADTVSIHPGTFDAIERLLDSGRYVGGATGVGLERWSFGLAVMYLLFTPLAWLTKMDTGLVFCRRADYVAVGGYDESRPVAEDVAFLMALRRLGKTRGQRLVRARTTKAVASTRKFDLHGDWHYFTMMPRVAFNVLVRRAGIRDAIFNYWYRPQR